MPTFVTASEKLSVKRISGCVLVVSQLLVGAGRICIQHELFLFLEFVLHYFVISWSFSSVIPYIRPNLFFHGSSL